MGEVYLAQDTSLNRKVALKVLPAELALNQDRIRRFKQEATAAASLNFRFSSRPSRKIQTTLSLGRAYEAKGMYDQAVAAFTKSQALNGVPPDALKKMNEVYAKSGWKAYVQINFDHLQQQGRQFPAFMIATFYARLERLDEAVKWLEKAYEERDFRMTVIGVAFEFENVRSDPRFKDLVRRMGLPE